ncbi:CotD family spore coat protein [Metabacillus niabensis]|uniref:Spore coat protein D n=1 Tax=Metabacillus niabensis TaxID=324854 RepID=A0ABT9Z3P2_9BACI|nr:CotD family spore coat protein [Metabacillus niabensis]MDQ0226876.1 spore coat protein D [Metabacillus niabensis]
MGRRSVYGKGRRGYNGNNGNVLGAFDAEDNNNNVLGAFDNGDDDVETIFEPTENIVNTTTNRRTVRRVHPTHIEHINRNIVRVENYYPVTQSEVEETYVEEFDCGRDLRNPCCKPVKRRHK